MQNRFILFILFVVFFVALTTDVSKINKNRTSHQRCSIKKGVLKNFVKFKGKDLCQSLFFDKVTGLFIKKENLAQVFFL